MTLAVTAELRLDLPGPLDDVWRLALFVAVAFAVGLIVSDALGGGGLPSTRLMRWGVVVLLAGRVGGMADNWDQPVSVWGPPFTTAALVLLYLGWRAYSRPMEVWARERTGTSGGRRGQRRA